MILRSAQSLTLRSMILRGVNLKKLEHLSEISTKTKTSLTHYSVAKASSNYEKNRSKISIEFPLKYDTEKSNDSSQYDTAQNLTPRSMILRGAL